MPQTADKPNPRTARESRLAWPVLVLVIGLLLTAVAGWLVHEQGKATDAVRFQRLSEMVRSTVSERLERVEEALHAAQGLFVASESVERGEWEGFARSMQPSLRRGVLGFGYAERVRRADLSSYLNRMHIGGAPGLRFVRRATGTNSIRSPMSNQLGKMPRHWVWTWRRRRSVVKRRNSRCWKTARCSAGASRS